ncbi:SitI3 family protein [Streptomyces sp. NPDC054833]
MENVVAFSCTLDIAASDSPLCVAEKLVHVASDAQLLQSPPPPAADLLTEGISTAHGTWLRVLAEDDEPDLEDPLVENLEFTPTTTVIFRYKKGAYEEQDEDVVLLSSRLLEEVPGDAVLHVDYESAKLARRAGKTSLSDDAELWTPYRLSLISQEYDRATLKID